MIPELNRIYVGDCLEIMRGWTDVFVQTVVTSPPYWGLRDYGVEGQIGMENSMETFTQKMVEVFREVRRVLREDGTLWLNLGDSYVDGGRGKDSGSTLEGSRDNQAETRRVSVRKSSGTTLKPKNLFGIPWRIAFALQADGWYLRQDIIWAQPNPMPESVMDRPTKAHEYLFLLSKSEQYFYDADAIREPAIYRTDERPFGDAGGNRHGDEKRVYKPPYSTSKHGSEKENRYKTLPEGQARIRVVRDKQRGHGRRHAGFNDPWDQMDKFEQCSAMRNKRSVWTVATSPFAEAHFATFPPNLIKPCILAGSRQDDIVFDPFMGAGTTGLVSATYGRNFIGTEINSEYVAMAERRIKNEMNQTKMLL